MTTGGYILANAIGGMISGAIGASAASGDHPVLRGALVAGAVSTAFSAAIIVGAQSAQKQIPASGTVSGWRFP